MSHNHQNSNSARRVVSGRLRLAAWEPDSLAHPQLKLFCDEEALDSMSALGPSLPSRGMSQQGLGGDSPEGKNIVEQIRAFREFGKRTQEAETIAATFGGDPLRVPTYINEFWTSKQRAVHRLHEISYRACFKPQLPSFFIDRLTQPGEVVYDPFMGRGTTLLEATLRGRVPVGCDLSPLSVFLCRPRLNPPTLQQVTHRLAEIDFRAAHEIPEDLLVFYHPETLRELCALREYLLARKANAELDAIDEWIWMVALSRLTGHSPGFFSVYTLPPNQAVTVPRQIILNEKRRQTPPRRQVAALIARKTKALLFECDAETRHRLAASNARARLLTKPASATPEIPTGSVSLVVTSPPFLDVVDYAQDNWLRCWFIGLDPRSIRLTVTNKLEEWQHVMTAVLGELCRVLRPGGHVAFAVGEVRKGQLPLEQAVLPCGVAAGLRPVLVLINAQKFTKTSHCWKMDNNSKGTNTNRIVLFRKDPEQAP
jgi:SAM-dependent methyltransferase